MERQLYNAGKRPAFREQYAKEFEWAAIHLPDKDPGLVATTLGMLRLAGQPTTTRTVMDRLKAQGRTRAQLEAAIKEDA
jgi:hypothetical protein